LAEVARRLLVDAHGVLQLLDRRPVCQLKSSEAGSSCERWRIERERSGVERFTSAPEAPCARFPVLALIRYSRITGSPSVRVDRLALVMIWPTAGSAGDRSVRVPDDAYVPV